MRPPASTNSLRSYIAGSRLLATKSTTRMRDVRVRGSPKTRSAAACSLAIAAKALSNPSGLSTSVVLGDMPLKADLLLIRRDPTVVLPFPFDLLGERTLVEYKSPDDAATQADLVKLEIYGLLYAWRE